MQNDILRGIARIEVKNSMRTVTDVIKQELDRLGICADREGISAMATAVRTGQAPEFFEEAAVNSIVVPKVMAMATPAPVAKTRKKTAE